MSQRKCTLHFFRNRISKISAIELKRHNCFCITKHICNICIGFVSPQFLIGIMNDNGVYFTNGNNGKEKKVANFVCCNLNSFGFIAVFVNKTEERRTMVLFRTQFSSFGSSQFVTLDLLSLACSIGRSFQIPTYVQAQIGSRQKITVACLFPQICIHCFDWKWLILW